MKRLLTTTTALSVALASMQPFPLFAQTLMEDGSVLSADGTLLCTPTLEAPCVLADYLPDADAEAAAAAIAAQAEAEAAAQADAAAQAEAAAAAEAQAAADAPAAEQDAAELQAQADADAQAQVQAEADAAAAVEAAAAADAAAQEELRLQADADAAAAAIAAQAEADAAAAAQAGADAQADADAAAAAQADADGAAAAQADADAAAAAQADADAAIAAQADADATAQADADAAEALRLQDEAAAAAAVQAENDAAAAAAAQADADANPEAAVERNADGTEQSDAEAAAAAIAAQDGGTQTVAPDVGTLEVAPEGVIAPADAGTEPAPVADAAADTEETLSLVPQEPTEAAVESLEQLLDVPVAAGDVAEATAPVAAAAAAVAAADAGAPLTAQTATDPSATVTTTTVTETTTRTSTEEFEEAPERRASGDGKNRLSDLEKVGLVALGALVVGAVLKNGDRVEQNTGDRVVLQRDDGRYVVYKDDDTLLRRPGSTVRTETFRDGSTRSIVERENGTQVVTIRDVSGRVLRRATYDERGREIVLIDDLVPETRVVVRDLPPLPREEIILSTSDGSAALRDAIRASESRDIGRSFSLRQVREIREVRGLAASIDVDSITFDSGSSAIRASEAEKLAKLGGLITDLVEENPNEVFLIEGHTDAVGSAASNLALSDRRAESVALALTEYFDVPPENLVVQGYGEAELRVETGAEERRNRRVAVRVVTGLLQQASLR